MVRHQTRVFGGGHTCPKVFTAKTAFSVISHTVIIHVCVTWEAFTAEYISEMLYGQSKTNMVRLSVSLSDTIQIENTRWNELIY